MSQVICNSQRGQTCMPAGVQDASASPFLDTPSPHHLLVGTCVNLTATIVSLHALARRITAWSVLRCAQKLVRFGFLTVGGRRWVRRGCVSGIHDYSRSWYYHATCRTVPSIVKSPSWTPNCPDERPTLQFSFPEIHVLRDARRRSSHTCQQ